MMDGVYVVDCQEKLLLSNTRFLSYHHHTKEGGFGLLPKQSRSPLK